MIKGNKKNNKEFKVHKNKEKGITLIVLVITIIIILILAGVTISSTIGDNGIISIANETVEKMRIAQIQDKLILWNLKNEIENDQSYEEILEELFEDGLLTEEEKNAAVENEYIQIGDTIIELNGTSNGDDTIVGTTTNTTLEPDTYFYDSTTVGEEQELIRYKKVSGVYYKCDENGIIENEDGIVVDEENLVEYTNAVVSSLTLGTGAYSANKLILGDGSDSTNAETDAYEQGYSEAEEVASDKSMIVTLDAYSFSTSSYAYFNISSVYPYYTEITASNIVVQAISYVFSHGEANNYGAHGTFSVTYTPSTGIIRVLPTGSYGDFYARFLTGYTPRFKFAIVNN